MSYATAIQPLALMGAFDMVANNTATGTSVTSGVGSDLTLVATRAGWMDVKFRRAPDPKWLDHADMGVASSYEFGRHCAIEWKRCVRETFPAWPARKPMPLAIHERLRDIALAERDQDIAPSYAFPGARTILRPKHLVNADLRNELIAKRLAALAPEREHFAY